MCRKAISILLKLLGNLRKLKTKLADDAANDQCLAIGHQVHILRHAYVPDKFSVDERMPEGPAKLVAI